MSIREKLKTAGVKKPLRVEVPGFDGEIYVRALTVGERDAYENLWLTRGQGGVKDFRSQLLCRVLCDESGSRIYTDADVAEVASLDGAMLSRVFDIAAAHNKLTEKDVRELAGE